MSTNVTCNCNNNDNAIILVRGNDTNFNNAQFLTIYLRTTILDLSTFKAVFKLGSIVKTFNDISEGKIELNFSAQETSKLLSSCYGQLNLVDTSNRIATIESLIPFEVISVVDGNAIATHPYTLNFDVQQGGENILNVSVESAVTVSVGSTVTLPAGSNATVTNVGTDNHLILNFGIPKGVDGDGIISVNGQTGVVELDYNDVNALSAQTTINDLTTETQQAALNSGANTENIGQISTNTNDILAINTTLSGYGNIVTHNVSEFATSAQGALADTALQPNDNISELVNNVGYITSAALPTLADLTTSTQMDAINSGITSALVTQIGINTTNIALKQDALVSGTNIKTINSNSILGSGNLTIDSLPSQTGQSGKFLTTDGTNASWATVDALPSQSGQNGKFLTTNGTAASWASVNTTVVTFRDWSV